MQKTSTTSGAEIVPLWTYQAKMDKSPLKDLKNYWESLRSGRLVPLRSEIDPRAIAGALEKGFIVERVQPGSVRFRLAGMHLCDLMGMEVRGMPLRAFIAPAARAEFSAGIERVFETPEIHEYKMISETPGGPPLMARMILLPLKSDNGQIDRAIGCIVTEGVVGLPPRRFRVTETTVTALTTGETTHSVTSDHRQRAGFAEAQAAYDAPPIVAKRPDGRPALRLVKSDLRGD